MSTGEVPAAAEAAVRIRAAPPQPKRLSRTVLLTGAGSLGLVVAFALLSGLSERPARGTHGQPEPAPAASPATPEALRALPARYDAAVLNQDSAATDAGGEEALDPLTQPGAGSRLAPPTDPLWNSPPPARAPAPPPPRAQAPAATQAPAAIFFTPRQQAHRPAHAPGLSTDQPIEGGGRREGFIGRQRSSADVLDSAYTPPRSAYELQAGAVIPAALITALNSDLPGRVIAQVTAPVYDSVSGRHLLIPQGARLIGSYDSANAYGDSRVFLVWNRIIMPNGWSLQLNGMEATDPAGNAGLRARTDNHLGRLGGAIGIAAVLSILANEAEDEGGSGNEQSFSQSVGDAAAQEAARVGGRLIDRQLNLRPTLRVRPGAPVRVLVTRDIQLRPYQP